MTLNSSTNIVSVLKQKMVENKKQVEKYKEEINEYVLCTHSIDKINFRKFL